MLTMAETKKFRIYNTRACIADWYCYWTWWLSRIPHKSKKLSRESNVTENPERPWEGLTAAEVIRRSLAFCRTPNSSPRSQFCSYLLRWWPDFCFLFFFFPGQGGHSYLKEWMWWAGLLSSKYESREFSDSVTLPSCRGWNCLEMTGDVTHHLLFNCVLYRLFSHLLLWLRNAKEEIRVSSIIFILFF